MNTKRKPLTFDAVLRLRFRRITRAQWLGFQHELCDVRPENARRLRVLVDDMLREHACRSEAFPHGAPYAFCVLAGIRFVPTWKPRR